ncbi:hypothetical protein C900_00165 [Fulvivirga imtechensis AK7]|uniref:Uncharacterized protein n=1 Tax=Fulvivirga imtechensis AK7 TaxID=1237149 RepID=L8JMA3_9BACT|nr:cell division protein ZapB [Fulvivirga imtechensis]ELR68654.1 hypothetical protein C900_00165 [Fulvivirga imtechensis AK7]
MKILFLTTLSLIITAISYGQDPLIIRENGTTYTDGDASILNLPDNVYGFTIRPYDAAFNGGTWNWHRDFGYRVDEQYWYAEGGFRVPSGKTVIGSWNPYTYSTLDITGPHSSNYYDAQLHLHTSNSLVGMFVGSHDAKYGVISQGGHYYNSGKFTAKVDQVSGMIQSYGNIYFFSNSGLTDGSTFTPSSRLTISNNGNVGIGRTGDARLDIRGEGNSYSYEHFIVRDQYNNKDFIIRGDGSVEIGYDIDVPNGYKLGVGGKAIMEEVVVQLRGSWPDYVFKENYSLTPLSDLRKYLEQNKHLPGIPNAKTVEEEGIEVGTMSAKLLEKIEELTLYVIDLDREVQMLKENNDLLAEQNNLLKQQVEQLKSEIQSK